MPETNSGYAPGAVMPDWMIRDAKVFDPFVDYGECPEGVVGYGLSSGGYDLRLSPKCIKVFTDLHGATVDPKRPNEKSFITFDYSAKHWWELAATLNTTHRCRLCKAGRPQVEQDSECPKAPLVQDYVLIPPHGYILGESVERISIPRDYIATCVGKSTYARCGIIVNVTPMEPGWRGILTIEIANVNPLPAKVYLNEGIAQVMLMRLEKPCDRSYDEKPRKHYQDQTGLTLARVRGA